MISTSEPTSKSQWIFLRGLAREARHWSTFSEKLKLGLAARGDDARVDAIDLPGAGRYSEMTAPITISEMTEFVRDKFNDIRRRMRESGEIPPDRTRILAVSLGGMVATDWIDRWPEDFRECVLINTSFAGFSPIQQRLKLSALAHFVQAAKFRSKLDREMHALELSSNRAMAEKDFKEKIAKEWVTYAEDRPFSPENFSRQLLAASRYRAPAVKPTVPLLVLTSEHDRMVDTRCSKEIARRWKTPIYSHPTAGHDLTLDDPDWVVEKLLAWETGLKEIPGPNSVLNALSP